MAQRIMLTRCINPRHKDDTPSMAVYDHGKKKLQVFCFGCKYHGWVSPTDIIDTPGSVVKTQDTEVKETQGQHISLEIVGHMVDQFFNNRHITQVPYHLITYGTDTFNNVIRPYFKYALLDEHQNTIGYQVRFLDTHKPKVKTISVGGKYPQYAVYNHTAQNDNVRITESWVDAVYLTENFSASPTYILLGTQPSKIDWYKFITSFYKKDETIVNLWFDGDKAGIECADRIRHTLTSMGVFTVNQTFKGRKIYEQVEHV